MTAPGRRLWTRANWTGAVPAVGGLSLLGLVHEGIAHLAPSHAMPHQWGPLEVSFVDARNRGSAWGWSTGHPGAFALALAGAVVVYGTIAALSHMLIAREYRWQRHALLLGAGGVIGKWTEWLTTGAVREYFHVSWAKASWPAFNVLELSVALAVAFFTFLALLRLTGRFRTPPHSAGELHDPRYERSQTLRILLAIVVALAFVSSVPDIISSVPLDVSRLATALGIPTLLAWFCFRSIPPSPPHAIFLRAFANDRKSNRLLRAIRRRVGRRWRVTGVTPPGERYRWRDILLIAVFPFVLLGDAGQVMTGGHTVFVGKDWKRGIAIALRQVQLAIFDARVITDSLVWEIGCALKTIGSARMYFVVEVGSSAEGLEDALRSAGAGITGIDPGRCFAEIAVRALADSIRANLSADHGALPEVGGHQQGGQSVR